MTVNDILTLVLSSLAFVISLLTFVYTIATRPRLYMLIGEHITLYYEEDKRVSVMTYFSFFNSGAQPGALVELTGTLSTTDRSKSVEIHWLNFQETRNIAQPGAPAEMFTGLTGVAHTIIVPGRAAGEGGIGQDILLTTKDPFILDGGTYILDLKGLIGPKLTRWCQASGTLKITPADAEHLAKECIASGGNYTDTLRLKRQHLSRRRVFSALFKQAIPDFVSPHWDQYSLSGVGQFELESRPLQGDQVK